VWVFAGGFLRWVYPKKPLGFFGYVLGCLNPAFNNRYDKEHAVKRCCWSVS